MTWGIYRWNAQLSGLQKLQTIDTKQTDPVKVGQEYADQARQAGRVFVIKDDALTEVVIETDTEYKAAEAPAADPEPEG